MSAGGETGRRFRWNDDMVALLRRLNDAGLTAREVAAEIAVVAMAGGVSTHLPSRSAVIAKTHSLRDVRDRDAERDVLAGRLRELVALGLTRGEIAERMGYGVTWVDQLAQRYQITLPRRPSPQDPGRDVEIRRLVLAGKGGPDIARITGFSVPAVYAAVRRMGLTLKLAARVKPGGWQQPAAGGKREPAPRKPLPHLRQVTPTAAPLVPQCSVVDLPDWSCHYPEGEPGTEGFHFCARRVAARPPKTPGAPALPATYCPDHTRLAYLPRRHTETIHKQARADLIACAAAAR